MGWPYVALARLDVLHDERTRRVGQGLGDRDEAGKLDALLVLGEHDRPVAAVTVVEVAIHVILNLHACHSRQTRARGCEQDEAKQNAVQARRGECVAYDEVELGRNVDAAHLLLLVVVEVELELVRFHVAQHGRSYLAQRAVLLLRIIAVRVARRGSRTKRGVWGEQKLVRVERVDVVGGRRDDGSRGMVEAW